MGKSVIVTIFSFLCVCVCFKCDYLWLGKVIKFYYVFFSPLFSFWKVWGIFIDDITLRNSNRSFRIFEKTFFLKRPTDSATMVITVIILIGLKEGKLQLFWNKMFYHKIISIIRNIQLLHVKISSFVLALFRIKIKINLSRNEYIYLSSKPLRVLQVTKNSNCSSTYWKKVNR